MHSMLTTGRCSPHPRNPAAGLVLTVCALIGCIERTSADSRPARAASIATAPAEPSLASSRPLDASPEKPPSAPTASATKQRLPRGQLMDDATARQLAARLATAKFTRTRMVDAVGRTVRPPSPAPSEFRVKYEAGRWQLSFGGPAGEWAEVSFDATGAHQSVQVGFAVE
jgi:hypothetical protein